MSNQNTTSPAYFAPGAQRFTLAEANARDIEAKIAAFDADIERDEQAIQRANDLLHTGWRGQASNPKAAGQVAEDIEAMHRRLRLTRSMRDGAAEELEATRRQISADKILGVRAEVDRIMSERTAQARNLVAAVYQAVRLLQDVDARAEQVLRMFGGDEQRTGLTRNEVCQLIGREPLQGYVEELFAGLLPKDVWRAERPIFGQRGDLETKLSDMVDRERTGLLATMDLRLEAIASGAKRNTTDTSPAGAAAASFAATQARAGAAASADGIH